MAEHNKKIIPFKKAFGIFILWGVFLAILGYSTYTLVLKKYIVDRPYVIKGTFPVTSPETDKK